MKFFSKTIAAVSSLVLGTAMLFSFGGLASADCFQYNSNGFTTSNTPVFNNICNVPNGTGDESNFVKIRPDTTGDDTSTSNNAAYADSLNAACNNGDSFDIHTYIHNDATQDQNNNGSGTAVAHGVQLSLAAPLNSTASNFDFNSTITATNAATVKDGTTLNCANGPVKLTLVPSSVKVYGTQYSWTGLPDGSVNETFKIGSPIINSGDQWGCWNYRIVVVYEVTVQKVQQPQVTAMCNLLTVEANTDRKVTVNQFKFTAINANFKSLVINWGDTTATTTVSNASQVVGTSHQYAANGPYQVSSTVYFTTANGDVASTEANCAQPVSFSGTPQTPPPSTPPATTTSTPPSQLVNTGPGSVIGLFGTATAAGTVLYRRLLSRRLSRQ